MADHRAVSWFIREHALTVLPSVGSLRALRHFDTYRGPAVKPWLLTILRNVCNAEFARRGKQEVASDCSTEKEADDLPLWQEPQASPEAVLPLLK